MTRLARLLGVTVLVGVVLAGPGQVSQMSKARADATITLTLPIPPSCCVKPIQMVYDLFKKSHPNVKLALVNTPNNLTAALTAGNAPDLISVDPGSAKTYYKAGYTIPMNAYYKKYGWDKKYYAADRDSFLVNGNYVGIPYDDEGIFLEYNATMFKQYGWSVPTDYNKLLRLSQQIQQKGIIPFAWGTADCQACDEWWLSTIVNSVLGPQDTKQLYSGNVSWTDPRIQAGLQRYVDYYQKGYITAKKSFATSMNGAQALFLRGKAAMMINGTWAFGTVTGSVAPTFELGFAIFPSWQPGGKPIFPLGTGGGYEINAKAKHPELLAALLNGWFDPSVEREMAVEGSPVPARIDYSHMGLKPAVLNGLKMMADARKNGTAGYVDYAWASPNVIAYLEAEGATLYLQKSSVAAWCQKADKQKQKDKAAGTLVPLADFGQ